jgi:hypothetical protein
LEELYSVNRDALVDYLTKEHMASVVAEKVKSAEVEKESVVEEKSVVEEESVVHEKGRSWRSLSLW